MPAPTIEELQAKGSLAAQLAALSRCCHQAEEAHSEGSRVRRELDRLHQAHPEEWHHGDIRLRVRKAWRTVWPLAVWFLDIGLLFYFLEFYVRELPGQLRNFCLLLIPGVFVFLEVGFSNQAAEARYRGDEVAARSWGRVATLWALAIAGGVGVLVWFQSDGFPIPVRGMVTFVLFGIALGAHLTLARAGDGVLDGIAYWRFAAAEKKLEQRAARLEREARQREQVAASRFQEYMAGFTQYTQAHPNGRLQAGPFDRVTQDVLRRAFGYAVIQTPDGSQPAGLRTPAAADAGNAAAPESPATQSPAAAPASASPVLPADENDGEVAYLREVLERTVRNQEGEVRP